MKRLYATTDPIEAEVLRALLRDRGIESTLDNDGGASLALGLPTGAVPLGINVSDEDAAIAAETLAGHFEKQQIKETEDDPEAPAPLSPDETASFEHKVRAGRPRLRFWVAFFLLLPTATGVVAYGLKGWWTTSGFFAVGFLVLIAAGWLIHALSGVGRKKREPAA